jgi:hypothetical protein
MKNKLKELLGDYITKEEVVVVSDGVWFKGALIYHEGDTKCYMVSNGNQISFLVSNIIEIEKNTIRVEQIG